MNLKQIFGQNVKYYRFQKHYTQEKLADIINTSPKYISRIELGLHNISLTKIEEIANALEIEPSFLLVTTNSFILPEKVNML